MEKSGNTITMNAGDIADLIEDYDDKIKISTHVMERDMLVSKLKALLFDMRKDLIYALRLIDAEE